MTRRRPLAAALVTGAALLAGCGREGPGAARTKAAPSDKATVSVPRVTARTGPSSSAPTAATLERGEPLQVLGPADGFWRAKLKSGAEVFLPAGSFERSDERAAREKRASAVAKFPAQPGRAIEPCPVLLAPDYGAARWGELRDGDDVAVVMPDHDFYGVRLPGEKGGLGFVPARSIRLMPPEEEENVPRPTRRPAAPPVIAVRPTAPAEAPPEARAAEAPPARGGEVYELLPAGSEPPVLESRVEPQYPELARRMGAEGEITMKIVVEADGSVGRVQVERGAHPALVDAASEAVKRWRYRPARVGGRPVRVYKTVRIRFTLRG